MERKKSAVTMFSLVLVPVISPHRCSMRPHSLA